MLDWRQWLDEKVLAVDLALDHLPATLSEKMTLIDKTVRELSEGYRLLAEAAEAREEYLTLANSPYPTRSEGEALKREYDEERLIEKMRKCHEIALDHLRGVGRIIGH